MADEWVKKCTIEYGSAMKKKRKKNEILPFETTQMDLEIIVLNSISQSEKDKCQLFCLYVECKTLK